MEVREQLCELALTFHHTGTGSQIHVARLGGKHFNPLNGIFTKAEFDVIIESKLKKNSLKIFVLRLTYLIAQAGVKLMILLSQHPNCCGYRLTPLHHPSGVGVGIWGHVHARPLKASQHRESTHTQEDEEWRRDAINPAVGTLDTFQGCFSFNWDSNCICSFNICLLQANIWETGDPFG